MNTETSNSNAVKAQAHIHSLDGELREVTILSHKNNNNVTAEYNGHKYTAVFNIFTRSYYVDDKYGLIE